MKIMRIGIAMDLLVFGAFAYAISPGEDLDSVLLGIYDRVVSPSESSTLLGETYTVTLLLGFASGRYLIFHNAFIEVKWI